MRFENTFWTSDYISGINTLLKTLEKSRDDGQDSLEYFKGYVDLLDIQSTKLKQLSIKSEKFLDAQSSETDAAAVSKIIGDFEQSHKSLGSLNRLKRVQAENTNIISDVKSSVSLKLQSDVIMRLRDFLEDYSDFILDSRKSLNTSYSTYTKANQQALAAEKSYINKTRELEDLDLRKSQEKTSTLSKSETKSPILNPVEPIEEPEDEIFKFPILVGTATFQTIEELKNFMVKITEEVPIKRRLIPIPGINNEYFSSESFFKWVKANIENEDSRRKIENFGQDLITLGLVSNWNKLAPNKFVSDEGYYEFTDLARYIAKFDERRTPLLEVTPSEDIIEPKLSRTGVFDGLKNRFKQNVDGELLKQSAKDANEKYLDAVNKSYLEKEKLESSIMSVSRRAEVYETNRLKLVYFLSKTFNEQVLDEYQRQIQAFQDIADDFTYNDETLNYELLKKSINDYSGWYWPKSDIKFSNYGNSKTTANVELFANDLMNQYRDPSNKDPKSKSVPLFLKKFIDEANDLEGVDEAWAKEIDILKASQIKRTILSSIPEYENQYNNDNFDIDINHFVTIKIINEVVHNYSIDEIIGFFKLWLLELPDSVVPFTAFDQLRNCYLENSDDEAKLKILGTVPRQNLASLLYISEHISSKVSNIGQLVKSEKVPLYHLLIRPSPKNLSAAVDDIVVFEPFCYDLLKKEFRDALYQKLNELEKIHFEREKRAEESLKRLKQAPKELSPPLVIPRSTSNNSLTVDGLRPFKTKSPMTSPAASPKVGRSRTNSNLYSPVRRPSDSLHKRTLSKSLDKEAVKKDQVLKNIEVKEKENTNEKQKETEDVDVTSEEV